ncbi:MAG: Mur ligase family protein, partial [Vicinamibacteria bacterium]|nr:Mur ligase family protein [Vicinamibacteria bacterium]
RRVLTYGLSPQAQITARDVRPGPLGSQFVVVAHGAALGEVRLQVPGAHNVLNALAAIAVGLDLGIPFEKICQGLESFTGVDRRFQMRGQAEGLTVIDDYGHHPTEIRATLDTLRTLAGAARTVVLFQPHRYTRTQALWDEFCRAFHQADVLLVTDIYPASESPIEGVTAEALAAAIAEKGHRRAQYVGSLAQASERLKLEARAGDFVLTLGAGSVWNAGEALLARSVN